jgi:hypothetical protein
MLMMMGALYIARRMAESVACIHGAAAKADRGRCTKEALASCDRAGNEGAWLRLSDRTAMPYLALFLLILLAGLLATCFF